MGFDPDQEIAEVSNRGSMLAIRQRMFVVEVIYFVA
jgi:hypothetical protein